MKKNDMAHLVLGMALLGSSLMGYGMEKIEGQKVEDIKLGSFKGYVASALDKDSLWKFFDLKTGYPKLANEENIETRVKEHLTFVQRDNFLQYYSPSIKGKKAPLSGEPSKIKQEWLKKACDFYQKNTFNAKDFLNLLKKSPKDLQGFLNFLSQKKDVDYGLRHSLEVAQTPTVGVFQEKDNFICIEKLYSAITDANDNMKCRFYEVFHPLYGPFNRNLVDETHRGIQPYCMAFLDLKETIGHVYYLDRGHTKKIATSTVAMIFEKDQPNNEARLIKIDPWLDRKIITDVLTKDSKGLKTKAIETFQKLVGYFSNLTGNLFPDKKPKAGVLKNKNSKNKKPDVHEFKNRKSSTSKSIKSGKASLEKGSLDKQAEEEILRISRSRADLQKQIESFFKKIKLENEKRYQDLEAKVRQLENERTLEKIKEIQEKDKDLEKTRKLEEQIKVLVEARNLVKQEKDKDLGKIRDLEAKVRQLEDEKTVEKIKEIQEKDKNLEKIGRLEEQIKALLVVRNLANQEKDRMQGKIAQLERNNLLLRK
jgi:hypothetical protein